MQSGKSLMYTMQGPNTVPWGTPLETSIRVDVNPSLWVQLLRNEVQMLCLKYTHKPEGHRLKWCNEIHAYFTVQYLILHNKVNVYVSC